MGREGWRPGGQWKLGSLQGAPGRTLGTRCCSSQASPCCRLGLTVLGVQLWRGLAAGVPDVEVKEAVEGSRVGH